MNQLLRKLLIICCLLNLSFLVHADTTTIYKVKHPDGSVSYSDQPMNNAEQMTVRPVETIPAFDVKNSPRLETQLQDQEDEPASYYTNLSILSPEPESAFYSGNGDIEVVVRSVPALKRQHLFQLSMDGQIIGSNQSGTFFIQGVDRGTHSLQARIVDANRTTLINSSSRFTLHRPSVLNPPKKSN